MAAPPTPQPEAVRFQVYTRFESVDASQNRHRVYELVWQPLLWGGGALVRRWGRRGQPGRTRITSYPDRASAQAAIGQVVRRRLQHGYQVMSWQ